MSATSPRPLAARAGLVIALLGVLLGAAPLVWASADDAAKPSAPSSDVTASGAPAPSVKGPPAISIPAASAAEGKQAFLDVHRVLTSPRCMNCHPDGDAPLQGDDSHPHQMLVRRDLDQIGMACATCHRDVPVAGDRVPPGAPHWGLPPRNQVFQDKTPAELCSQLKNPATTGGRDLSALLHHVTHDALVLWGFSPGPRLTTPPLSHERFVTAFTTWVGSGGACPDPTPAP